MNQNQGFDLNDFGEYFSLTHDLWTMNPIDPPLQYVVCSMTMYCLGSPKQNYVYVHMFELIVTGCLFINRTLNSEDKSHLLHSYKLSFHI